MKRPILILLACALLGITSCANLDNTPIIEEPFIDGVVTDIDENPIEHIQVTLEWAESNIKDTVYTSSEGKFHSIAHLSDGIDTELKITLEDIDGEEHGGEFEKSEKAIILFEADSLNKLDFSFLLNHATPLESNPQP